MTTPMHLYKVFLIRVDFKAGPSANFQTEVRAPNEQLAKRTAEAQYPGYRCSACTRIPGT